MLNERKICNYCIHIFWQRQLSTTENAKRKRRKRKKLQLQEPKLSRDYRSGSESDANLGEGADDNEMDIDENDLDSGQGSAGEDFSTKVRAKMFRVELIMPYSTHLLIHCVVSVFLNI